MRTESSVIVALGDLRRIELERVAEERAKAEEEERKARAEEEARERAARELVEAQAQVEVLREKLERERDRQRERERERAHELELARSREREPAPAPALVPARLPRGWAVALALTTAAAVGMFVLMVTREPIIRERMVPVPAAVPVAAPIERPAPAAAIAKPEPQPVAARPVEKKRKLAKKVEGKTTTGDGATLLETIARCKDDPACGADPK